jgi:hypothetical protein
VGPSTGAGCGSTIAYDLADWRHPSDPRSPLSDALLMIMLRQANLEFGRRERPHGSGLGGLRAECLHVVSRFVRRELE